MARNWIQFQKGYGLMQFVDEYGTEEQCAGALSRWCWPNGFVCPRGEHSGYWRLQSRVLLECSGCRYQVSVTASTIPAAPNCRCALGAFASEDIAAWAKCHLDPGTLVLSDALACCPAVQRAGCFHQPVVTGGGPASAEHQALSWVNTILDNVKRSLHGSYHHVSS